MSYAAFKAVKKMATWMPHATRKCDIARRRISSDKLSTFLPTTAAAATQPSPATSSSSSSSSSSQPPPPPLLAQQQQQQQLTNMTVMKRITPSSLSSLPSTATSLVVVGNSRLAVFRKTEACSQRESDHNDDDDCDAEHPLRQLHPRAASAKEQQQEEEEEEQEGAS